MKNVNFKIGQLRPTSNGSLYFQNEEMNNFLGSVEPKEIWDNGTKVWGSGITQTDNSFFISALYNKVAENILQIMSEGEIINDFEMEFTYAQEGEEYADKDGIINEYKTTGIHMLKINSVTLSEKLDKMRAKEALKTLREKRKNENKQEVEFREKEEEKSEKAIEELLAQ